ncbi:hypothetical protein pb186bvf_020036 [Paramecium bursaria]
MDTPKRPSNLKSAEIREVISSLCSKKYQKPIKREDYDQVKRENEQLNERVKQLEEKVVYLQQQLDTRDRFQEQQIEVEEPIRQELTEEEASLEFALMLQRQEQQEFQNRLYMYNLQIISRMGNIDTEGMTYEELQDLQEKIGYVSRGFTQQDITNIVNKNRLQHESDECCTICLEDGQNPIEIMLECRHVFHGPCIEEWLSREKQCPVCKKEIQRC